HQPMALAAGAGYCPLPSRRGGAPADGHAHRRAHGRGAPGRASHVTWIDFNCDMGESFGPWRKGADEAIMPHITSANVACGAHAGDPDTMAATVKLARSLNVAAGAHPGYPDLIGFGRRPMRLSRDEVMHTILYQLGALWAIARAEELELSHVKPHGA